MHTLPALTAYADYASTVIELIFSLFIFDPDPSFVHIFPQRSMNLVLFFLLFPFHDFSSDYPLDETGDEGCHRLSSALRLFGRIVL